MNLRHIMLSMAVLALVAVVVVGCGGGDDAATASISKAQFVKKADAICAREAEQLQDDLAALLKEQDFTLNEKHTEAQAAGVIALLASNLERQIEGIRALGAPGEDEDQVTAILEGMEEGVEKAEDDPLAIMEGEVTLFGEATELASEYGLETCAQV